MRLNQKRPTIASPLTSFLDPRRDEAAVAGKAERKRVEEGAADRIGGGCGQCAEQQQAQRFPQGHQLEDVQPDEHHQHDQHRDQGDRPIESAS